MTSAMCWAREENIKASSARGERPAVAESRRSRRIFSPVTVPPGSRVTTTGAPCSRSTRSQPLHLSAFSAPVQTFESNEPAAMMIGRHAEIINEHIGFGTCHIFREPFTAKVTKVH